MKILVEIPYIDWDVDEKEDLENLPESVNYNFERSDFDCSDSELQDEIEEFVADKLSEDFGFCHNGFKINIKFI